MLVTREGERSGTSLQYHGKTELYYFETAPKLVSPDSVEHLHLQTTSIIGFDAHLYWHGKKQLYQTIPFNPPTSHHVQRVTISCDEDRYAEGLHTVHSQ